MSVSPELMTQMMQQRGAGSAGGASASPPGAGMPPGAGAPQGPGPPAAAPISKPQDKKGLKVAAMTNIHIAANMLEEALPAFGSESQEGQKILSALKVIGPLLAKRDSSDLVPAEILQMVKSLPQMGGGTNVQRQIMQQMAQGQQKPQAAAA
jgi:hypothetical protein